MGVAVYFRAEPAMTQQWLGRLTECHLAHHAVVGRLENDQCPLSFESAEVSLSSTPDGFRIAVTTRDPEVARSVIASGQELLGKPGAQLAREWARSGRRRGVKDRPRRQATRSSAAPRPVAGE